MICALLNCRCGHSPTMVRRATRFWYCCFACGMASAKSATIPDAAAAWNSDRERERTDA